MSQRRTVHVALLDEGTAVWRPVQAEHVRGNEYVLFGPIPEGEVWEFQPGAVVQCRPRTLPDGSTALVAWARASRGALESPGASHAGRVSDRAGRKARRTGAGS